MIKIHDKVIVVQVTDEVGDPKYIGHYGLVVSTIIDDVGATPQDPGLVVHMEKFGNDLFWEEELLKIE